MKKLSLITILLLTACNTETPFCEREYEPVICKNNGGYTRWDHNEETFKICMDALAKARSSEGGNYSTNDDEDLDSAIKQCRISADNIRLPIDWCYPNPKYEVQKEHCNNEN